MRSNVGITVVATITWFAVLVIAVLLLRRPSDHDSSHYHLPRIVWAYWDDPEPPEFIARNLQHWREALGPTWDVRVLNRDDAKSVLPPSATAMSVAHQSDWLRLYLLKEHGGAWMDAGIVLNSPDALNALRHESIIERSEWTGFRLGDKLENWFIMAPKGSRIVREWFAEYDRAVHSGFRAYRHTIEEEGVDTADIYSSPTDVYLTQHACLRAVLSRMDAAGRRPPMVVKDAMTAMFKLHGECDWHRDCILTRLDRHDSKSIPYIKLRGADRPER